MGQRWSDYEKAAEHGPLKLIVTSIVGGLAVFGILWAISYSFGWVGGAADVAKNEFGAKAALTKYEWFKDAAAQLEKKQADIRVYEARIKSLQESYGNEPRSKWSRVDQEANNLAVTELAGIKASYNQLAAEYNSQSSKFNWSYAQGEIPRTFQPMVEQ